VRPFPLPFLKLSSPFLLFLIAFLIRETALILLLFLLTFDVPTPKRGSFFPVDEHDGSSLYSLPILVKEA